MKESTHQKKVASHLRKEYPKIPFIINPFSGAELYGMTKMQKIRFLKEMQAQGWEKSVPDIIIPVARMDYTSLAIELKKPDTYPFKPWRKNGGFFIERTKDQQYLNHVLSQAAYLADLKREGGLAVFCSSAAHAVNLIDAYLTSDRESIELGQFSFHWGRYVPEEKEIDFLVK